jgi:hypothetical protein
MADDKTDKTVTGVHGGTPAMQKVLETFLNALIERGGRVDVAAFLADAKSLVPADQEAELNTRVGQLLEFYTRLKTGSHVD